MDATTNMLIDFEKLDKAAWQALLLKELKATSLENLIIKSYEGINIAPFYTKEDLASQQDFTQVIQQINACKQAGWQTVQIIPVKEEKIANQLAIKALKENCESIILDLYNFEKESIDLNVLLADIVLKPEQICFKFHQPHFLKHLENTNFTIHFDPLGYFTQTGLWDENNWDIWASFLIKNSNNSFYIDAAHFYNAGGNAVQELAFCLNTLVEYAHQLSERGVNLANFFKKAIIGVSIGDNYFVEIAKIRALRVLWNQIVTSFLGENIRIKAEIHSFTATWNKSQKDIHNNIIRTTTEAMSAIIGGCDKITVLPYNVDFEDKFAARIARNISNILKEEAYLDKVIDISAGTYYIEFLTKELMNKSWLIFQEVEAKGGFLTAFQQQFIQNEIEKIADQKIQDFLSQKKILVGVNKYQKANEEVNLNEFHLVNSKRLEKYLK